MPIRYLQKNEFDYSYKEDLNHLNYQLTIPGLSKVNLCWNRGKLCVPTSMLFWSTHICMISFQTNFRENFWSNHRDKDKHWSYFLF